MMSEIKRRKKNHRRQVKIHPYFLFLVIGIILGSVITYLLTSASPASQQNQPQIIETPLVFPTLPLLTALPTLPAPTALPTLPLLSSLPTLAPATALPTLPPATALPTLPPATAVPVLLDEQSRMLPLLNNLRSQQGVQLVRINNLLTNAAQKHSNDMANGDFMAHVGSDGSQPGTRATAAGYQWRTVGENVLLRHDVNTEEAFQQWFNSQGHYDNMVNPNFDEVGIAYAQSASGTVYYTMLLGSQN